MRNIEKRAFVCLLLALFLTAGLGFFCYRYVTQGGDWASYPFNRHMYNNQGQLISGAIYDRDGDALSECTDGKRTYYPDATVRKATLHAVGDPQGNIGTGALTAFADTLSGYNLVTGGYSPTGAGPWRSPRWAARRRRAREFRGRPCPRRRCIWTAACSCRPFQC